MTPIRGVLLDLSGVLYVGDEALPGAVEAVARLRASDLALGFVTNTTRSTRARIGERLRGLGFGVQDEEILTAPSAVRGVLERRGLTPHLLIHPDLETEFADLRGPRPDAVVLGDAGEFFDYAALNAAFRLLMEGAPLLAMGDNRYFREADGLSLDIGPFLRALEYAAEVRGEVLGKPAPGFFAAGVARLGCAPEAVLMVGDDAVADVEGALRAGLQGALLRTGKYRAGDEARIALPGAGCHADLAACVDDLLGA